MATTPTNRVEVPPLYFSSGEPNVRTLVWMRLLHDLSRAELAQLLGVDPKTLRTWERAQATPRGRNRTKLHKFLQASAAIMERHEGTIPPEHSFRRQLPDEQGSLTRAWELEGENRMLREVISGTIVELETQLEQLRSLLLSYGLDAMARE